MKDTKIGKKIEIETINLKLLTEQVDQAEKQLKEGADDLQYRLSHFRKKVDKSDIEKYDMQFFGASQEKDNLIIQSQQISKGKSNSSKKNNLKKSAWIKKIYRKIVASTHPDKFSNFSIKVLKEKYLKIYRKTINSWANDEDDQILICAYETDIIVENPEALPILKEGIAKKKKRNEDIKRLLAYQWYHIPVHNRPAVLEEYLKELGYQFTKNDIKKVVNLARKRKVGTRPKSLKELRRGVK